MGKNRKGGGFIWRFSGDNMELPRKIPTGGEREGMEFTQAGFEIRYKETTPGTFDERIAKLKEIQRGWVNYFRMGSIQNKLKEIDGGLFSEDYFLFLFVLDDFAFLLNVNARPNQYSSSFLVFIPVLSTIT